MEKIKESQRLKLILENNLTIGQGTSTTNGAMNDKLGNPLIPTFFIFLHS